MKFSPSTKVPDPTGIFVPKNRSTWPNGSICTHHANKEIGPLPSNSSKNYDFFSISIQNTICLWKNMFKSCLKFLYYDNVKIVKQKILILQMFLAVDRAVWEITASYWMGLLVGSYWSILTQNSRKTSHNAAKKNRQSCRVQMYPAVTNGLF